MKQKSLLEINEIYDLELEKIINNIIKTKSKKVLLQFPEGMKPYSLVISSYIEEKTSCQCFIWMETCYGACDLPLEVERIGIDLIVHFGHSPWRC